MNKKKRRLLLVGAGAMGRELASWIRFDVPEWADFEFGGFLGDNPHGLDDFPAYCPGIVSAIADFKPNPGDALVMAIADPTIKLAVAQKLDDQGAEFLSFVHPSVLIADHVLIGRGVVICPNAVVSCHAVIGDFVSINLSCTVGHDVRIGRGCTLSAHVDLTGFASLEEGVFLGSHASVLPRAKIGAFAKVGAGSVVLRSVKGRATVMGVPAKQILP
jgi:sugar O-acyltransferase (sialic acid O-acetyltransferase NeuD family)